MTPSARRLVLVACIVLGVTLGLPVGLPTPPRGSEFPLAGLLQWVQMPAWALGDPDTPEQLRGGPVSGTDLVDTELTQADGGAGRAPRDVPNALDPYEPPGQEKKDEWTTPGKGKGYVPGESKWLADDSSPLSDVYENADGTFTQRVHQTQQNYVGKDGKLRPIDSRFGRAKDGTWRVAGAPVQVELSNLGGETAGVTAGDSALGTQTAAGEDAPELVSLTLPDGQIFAYGLQGAALTEPQVSGSAATYQLALSFTDVELIATGTGVKENLILHSADAANSWVFPLRLEGLIARMEPDGSVALLDEDDPDGKPLMRIPAGYMQDSKVQPDGALTTSEAISYQLIEVDGEQALRMTADREWLDDPERVYPVTVDPATTIYDNANDVHVSDAGVHDEDNLSVGCWDEDGWGSAYGCDRHRAYMRFNYYDYAYGAPGNSMAGVKVTGGRLQLHHTWNWSCDNKHHVSAYRVTQPWSPSAMPNGRYPGANVGDFLGSVYISDNYPACENWGADRSIGKWWAIEFTNVDMFHDWSLDSTTNHGIALLSHDVNDLTGWRRFTSRNYTDATGISREPYLELDWEYNKPPQVSGQYPTNGYATPTLTPELMATVNDPDAFPYETKLLFTVYDKDGNVVVDSGWTTARNWRVPSGKLTWGNRYRWTVYASDGMDTSTSQSVHTLSTDVPQPPITSELSQNSGRGFSADIGNYTTSATDAQIASVGPMLSVDRFYNSLDPRTTGAFGAGWSSLLDAKVIEQGETAVVTYPDGREVAFGRNADGSYVSPSGRHATLTKVAGGFEFVDKAGTKYSFAQDLGGGTKFGITAITDVHNRAQTMTWSGGHITTLTSASGRKLHLTWSTPLGSVAARVTKVATEEAVPGDSGTVSTWTYTFNRDQLLKVCPPTSATACSQYEYGSNSLYPTAVLDRRPYTYLRMNEPSGSAVGGSSVLYNPDGVVGSYDNVTLGRPGPRQPVPGVWNAPTAAGFNGTDSHVELPRTTAWSATSMTASVWFRTTGSGVLYGFQNRPLDDSANATTWTPALYVDSSGYLHGELWTGAIETIKSAQAVNDGTWHHAVLTGAGNIQKLYLDGVKVGERSGIISDQGATNIYLGAGKWELWPGASGTVGHFTGDMADFSFHTAALTDDQIVQLHAGDATSKPMTKVLRPSGAVSAEISYDELTGQVTEVTDANGGVWTISAPQMAGSSLTYQSAALAGAPADYFRLAESGVTEAVNQVNGGTATYSTVTLGVDGPFPDATAAGFDGTSSFIALPENDVPGAGPASASMWFKTTGHGVLYSYQTGSATNPEDVTGGWVPALYVGTDGKLRGQFWGAEQQITTPGTVNDGKWHHVALAGSSNSLAMYLDGAIVGGPVAGDRVDVPGPGFVGAGRWADGWPAHEGDYGYFNGQIAEFAFYRGELAADLVHAQFTARDSAADGGAGAGNPVKTVTVTGPDGEQTVHSYDLLAGGRQVRMVDARDGITDYGYDVGGFLRTVTDPNGNMTIEEHDVRGNVIAQTSCQDLSENKCSTTYFTHYPDNASRSLTPDPRNDMVLTIRDARSSGPADGRYLVTYSYDASGNLTTVTDQLGRQTRTDYTYPSTIPVDLTGLSGTGRYLRMYGTKGYLGNLSIWELEAYGPDSPDNLAEARPTASSSDWDSNYLSQYAVDGDPSTRWSSVGAGNTEWIYVDLGSSQEINRLRLLWEVARGIDYQIQLSDDATNWTTIKSVVGQDGTMVPSGLPWRITTPSGAVTRNDYLASGDITRVVDAAGLAREFSYDNLGRVLTQTTLADDAERVSRFGYDKLGRVVSQIDPAVIDRVTGATHTKNTSYAFNDDGDVVSATVSDGTGGDAARTVNRGYNTLGQLIWEENPLQERTSYTYDTHGNVTSVTGPDNVTTAFGYDPLGNLTTTTVKNFTGDPNDPFPAADQLMESRAYDPAGRLAKITDAMGWATEYTYSDNGLTATVTRRDPATGASFVAESNGYDAAGNLIQQVTSNGTLTTQHTYDAAGRKTEHTVDPAGVNRSSSYTFNDADQVTSIQIADGSGPVQTIEAVYDRAGRKLSQTVATSEIPDLAGRWLLDGNTDDAYGNSTGTANNVTFSSERDGAALFNGADSTVSTDGPVIDATDSFTVSAWVKLGDKSWFGGAVSANGDNYPGFTIGYAQNADKWRMVMCDEDNSCRVQHTVYSGGAAALDTWTHLTGKYDADAKTMTLYVNGSQQGSATIAEQLRITGPLSIGKYLWGGNDDGLWDGSIDDVQAYQRALSDAEISQIYQGTGPGDEPGIRTSFTYNDLGLPVSQTDPNGNTSYVQYDEAGGAAVITSPSVTVEEYGVSAAQTVAVTRTGFDTFGSPVTVVDSHGRQTSLEYDAAGRPIKTVSPSYTPPGSAEAVTPVSLIGYDAAGRVDQRTDALGRITAYAYDQLGQLASVTAPDTATTRYEYSLAGAQTAVVDAAGGRAEATYDYLGRQLTSTELAGGQAFTTEFAYNAAGFLDSVSAPGRDPARQEYNAVGEPIKVIDASGAATSFGYDGAGRPTRTTLADGSYSEVSYDAAGRPVAEAGYTAADQLLSAVSQTYDAGGNVLAATDARGNTTSYAYNALGWPSEVTQPVTATDSITVSFGYDVAGDRTRFTNGRGHDFWTTYNSLGLPESEIEPVTAVYSAESDRTYTTVYDAVGQVVAELSPGGVQVAHSYDAMGRIIGSAGTGAQVATEDRVFEYDPVGRITKLSGTGGDNTLTWDDRGLLTSVTGSSGDSSFTWTPDGLMAARTDAAGTTSYGYDQAGRLASVANPDTGVDAAYTYNVLSQVAEIAYGADQNRRTFGYDDWHRLASDTLSTSSGDTLASISYGYDANGNITSKDTTGFTGAGANLYTYDEANRLTSWSVDGGATSTYGYDKAGNRVQAGAKTFSYDARNRLTSDSDGTEYRYTPRGVLAETVTGTVVRETKSDAFGQIVSQQHSDTGFSTFTYDGLGRAIQPGHSYTGLENDLAADADATYTRAPDGAVLGVARAGDTRLTWTDQHTDLVAQFTATGTSLSGSVTFDPFGEILDQSGVIGSLGYQSEWTDALSGRVNMHARWYNPGTGQFDSRDTWALSPIPASVNANRHAYANNNPLYNTDPSGHWIPEHEGSRPPTTPGSNASDTDVPDSGDPCLRPGQHNRPDCGGGGGNSSGSGSGTGSNNTGTPNSTGSNFCDQHYNWGKYGCPDPRGTGSGVTQNGSVIIDESANIVPTWGGGNLEGNVDDLQCKRGYEVCNVVALLRDDGADTEFSKECPPYLVNPTCRREGAPTLGEAWFNGYSACDIQFNFADVCPSITAALNIKSARDSEKAMIYIQLALAICGFVPVVGEPCDGLDAAFAAATGDTVGAGLSAAAAVPIIGWGAGSGRIIDLVKLAEKMDNAVVFGKLGTKISDRHALTHSFGKHAKQWFGREVSEAKDLDKWFELIVKTSESRKVVEWSANGRQTYLQLARVDGGRYFAVQTDRRTGELVTAFDPTPRQLGAIFDKLKGGRR